MYNIVKQEEIEQKQSVGRGATAIVYEAVWKNVVVAYKLFFEGGDAKEFLSEASIMRLLFILIIIINLTFMNSKITLFIIISLII